MQTIAGDRAMRLPNRQSAPRDRIVIRALALLVVAIAFAPAAPARGNDDGVHGNRTVAASGLTNPGRVGFGSDGLLDVTEAAIGPAISDGPLP
jgi:hypothetical protein